MYNYKIKYIVVAEDEDGNFIEIVNEEYLDSAQEAHEFIKALENDI